MTVNERILVFVRVYTKTVWWLFIYHGGKRDLKITLGEAYATFLYIDSRCIWRDNASWFLSLYQENSPPSREGEKQEKEEETSIWLKMTLTKTNLKSIEDKKLHGILSCTCFDISVNEEKKQKTLTARVLWWLNK